MSETLSNESSANPPGFENDSKIETSDKNPKSAEIEMLEFEQQQQQRGEEEEREGFGLGQSSSKSKNRNKKGLLSSLLWSSDSSQPYFSSRRLRANRFLVFCSLFVLLFASKICSVDFKTMKLFAKASQGPLALFEAWLPAVSFVVIALGILPLSIAVDFSGKR